MLHDPKTASRLCWILAAFKFFNFVPVLPKEAIIFPENTLVYLTNTEQMIMILKI